MALFAIATAFSCASAGDIADALTAARCNEPETADAAQPVEVFLHSPNGGETWETGRTYKVQWTIANGTPNFRIDLYFSADGGATWPHHLLSGATQGQPGPGEFGWPISPSLAASAYCRMKIFAREYDGTGDTAADYSEADFTIVQNATPPPQPSVEIGSPAPGSKLYAGSTCAINWTVSGGTAPFLVSIYLSQDSGATFPASIIQGVPQNATGAGAHIWAIPSAQKAALTYRLRVEVIDAFFLANGTTQAGDFQIAVSVTPPPPGKLAVTLYSPNGGETLVAGRLCNVTWASSSGVAPKAVRIEFSVSGASGPYSTAAEGLNDTGICRWTVPAESSAQCFLRVMVTDSGGATASDCSDAAFSISNPAMHLGNMAGKVTSAQTQTAIAKATVVAYVAGTAQKAAEVKADSAGRYYFPAIAEGDYDIKASATGYSDRVLRGIALAGGKTSWLNISLQKAPDTAGGGGGGSGASASKGIDISLIGPECMLFLAVGLAVIIGTAAGASSHARGRRRLERLKSDPTLCQTGRSDEFEKYLREGRY